MLTSEKGICLEDRGQTSAMETIDQKIPTIGSKGAMGIIYQYCAMGTHTLHLPWGSSNYSSSSSSMEGRAVAAAATCSAGAAIAGFCSCGRCHLNMKQHHTCQTTKKTSFQWQTRSTATGRVKVGQRKEFVLWVPSHPYTTGGKCKGTARVAKEQEFIAESEKDYSLGVHQRELFPSLGKGFQQLPILMPVPRPIKVKAKNPVDLK